jgi:cobalt/nickel transport system ATP-binding protein
MIEVRDLHYTYPDGRKALQGLTLEARAGERIALLGPNGAGKTTLALHLNGILTPAAGAISVGGLAVEGPNLPEVRRRVGLVFQDPNDQLFMPSVFDDVAFGPANLGLRDEELRQRVVKALDAVDAGDLADRAPHHLSGGEKRRAAIATVLAMEPQALVLDEPTSGLDPAGRRELIETLRGIAITQIIITHDLAMAAELCERSLIMADGKIRADGATADLLADDELLARHRLEMI